MWFAHARGGESFDPVESLRYRFNADQIDYEAESVGDKPGADGFSRAVLIYIQYREAVNLLVLMKVIQIGPGRNRYDNNNEKNRH
jgi:hypothetical protein